MVNIYLIKIKLGKKKITDKPGKNAAKGKATKIKIVSAGTAQSTARLAKGAIKEICEKL